MEIMISCENHGFPRKSPDFTGNRDFHENVGFAERRASKTPRNGYVYKGFWRRRRGKLDFRGNRGNPGNPAKMTDNAEILEFHQNTRKQKITEMGKVWIPGNRGPPARPPLAARCISKPQDNSLRFIKIRQGFAVERLKCAPFSM